MAGLVVDERLLAARQQRRPVAAARDALAAAVVRGRETAGLVTRRPLSS
jgi:hypothetical protein